MRYLNKGGGGMQCNIVLKRVLFRSSRRYSKCLPSFLKHAFACVSTTKLETKVAVADSLWVDYHY